MSQLSKIFLLFLTLSIVTPTFIQAYDVFHIETLKGLGVETENEAEKLDWYPKPIDTKKDHFKFSFYYQKPSITKTVTFYPSVHLKCFCPPPEV